MSELIAELRVKLAAATPGPWEWDGWHCEGGRTTYMIATADELEIADCRPYPWTMNDPDDPRFSANAEAIVALHNAAPDLFAALEAVQELHAGEDLFGDGTLFCPTCQRTYPCDTTRALTPPTTVEKPKPSVITPPPRRRTSMSAETVTKTLRDLVAGWRHMTDDSNCPTHLGHVSDHGHPMWCTEHQDYVYFPPATDLPVSRTGATNQEVEAVSEEDALVFLSTLFGAGHSWEKPGQTRQDLTDANVALVREFVAQHTARAIPVPDPLGDGWDWRPEVRRVAAALQAGDLSPDQAAARLWLTLASTPTAALLAEQPGGGA